MSSHLATSVTRDSSSGNKLLEQFILDGTEVPHRLPKEKLRVLKRRATRPNRLTN